MSDSTATGTAEQREAQLRRAASLTIAERDSALTAGDYATACSQDWNDAIQPGAGELRAFDVINQGNLRADDVVALSDGHCYSRQGMREWLSANIAGGRTGRVYLPLTRKEASDDDYRRIGVPVPSEAELSTAHTRTMQALYGGQAEAQRGEFVRRNREDDFWPEDSTDLPDDIAEAFVAALRDADDEFTGPFELVAANPSLIPQIDKFFLHYLLEFEGMTTPDEKKAVLDFIERFDAKYPSNSRDRGLLLIEKYMLEPNGVDKAVAARERYNIAVDFNLLDDLLALQVDRDALASFLSRYTVQTRPTPDNGRQLPVRALLALYPGDEGEYYGEDAANNAWALARLLSATRALWDFRDGVDDVAETFATNPDLDLSAFLHFLTDIALSVRYDRTTGYASAAPLIDAAIQAYQERQFATWEDEGEEAQIELAAAAIAEKRQSLLAPPPPPRSREETLRIREQRRVLREQQRAQRVAQSQAPY